MKVGVPIRKARETAGLTQGQLAERARLHRTYVSMLEHDKYTPTLEVFCRICEGLGVSAPELLAEIQRFNQRKK